MSIVLPGNWAQMQAAGVMARAERAGITSAEAFDAIDQGCGLGGHYLATRESDLGHAEAKAQAQALAQNGADSLEGQPSQWHGRTAEGETTINRHLLSGE